VALQETRPVRASEQLDWPSLDAWLRERLAARDIPLDLSPPLRVEQFPGGHSNLTYLLRYGETELVLRRPPLGPVPPKAHDMAREFHWLRALHPVFPLAPRAYALCDDPAVAGSVFYVMERRHGIVVRHEEPEAIKERPRVRRAVGLALVDALADLHAVDLASAGLLALGKPEGFVTRQVMGWSERWRRAQTTTLPEMDVLADWLVQHLPNEPARPTVVHGDFKLDNVMLNAGRPEHVVAVFDWEMSALGDPLVDLGILLAYWVPSSPPGQIDALTTVTQRPGWPERNEIVERYAQRSGRDVATLAYYELFALFKIAVVIQQIFFRFVNGQTDDQRFAAFGERVRHLARRATALMHRAG
jgi:aminoglycoside phosphotransferase (APT) family kinase protein